MSPSSERAAASFVPGHADKPHSAGVAAQVGSEAFIEALARVVFYWACGLADYMSPSQRWVVTPNNDMIYGVGFADRAR